MTDAVKAAATTRESLWQTAWVTFLRNAILVILVVMLILAVLFAPGFRTAFNMQNLFLQALDLLFVAVGVTFVVLNGGIDFSSTSVMALGSVVGAWVMSGSPVAHTAFAIPAGIAAILCVGVVFGIVNGLSVVVLKMPSFIATLGTMMIGSGVAVWITSIVTDKASIIGIPAEFFIIGGDGKNFLVPAILAVTAVGIAQWTLGHTTFGLSVMAVGTNPRAALVSGVKVKRVIFLLMLASSVFAAVAAMYATARTQAGLPTMGDKIFIDIIGAIILGGTSIFGGSGGIRQTVVGVAFIALLNNVVNLLSVDWTLISLIKGVLIIAAALLDYYSRRADQRTGRG